MDLGTAAKIATSVAVLVAVVFGLSELRRGTRERRDRASAVAYATFVLDTLADEDAPWRASG